MSMNLIHEYNDLKQALAQHQELAQEVRKLRDTGVRVICGQGHSVDNPQANYVFLSKDLGPTFDALDAIEEASE